MIHSGRVFAKARLASGKEQFVMDAIGELLLVEEKAVHPKYGDYDSIAAMLAKLFTLPARSGRETGEPTTSAYGGACSCSTCRMGAARCAAPPPRAS